MASFLSIHAFFSVDKSMYSNYSSVQGKAQLSVHGRSLVGRGGARRGKSGCGVFRPGGRVMKRSLPVAVLFAMALAVGTAIADMAPRPGAASERVTAAPASAAARHLTSGSGSPLVGTAGALDFVRLQTSPALCSPPSAPGQVTPSLRLGGRPGSLEDCQGTVIWEAPPPPGSASLALAGLLGVAGVQVARSARQWHLGGVSDWLSVQSLQQNVDGSLDAPQIVRILLQGAMASRSPATARPSVRVVWDFGCRITSQCVVLSVLPRGPPPTL